MITIENIHKRFGSLEVLKGISLHVKRGELVSIVGASGAGKTTLLQIMATLSRPDEGSLSIDGVALEKLNDEALSRFRNQKVGIVFQFHHLLPEFSALENVTIPALIAGRSRQEAETEARRLLQMLGLEERADHKPSQLSGGEQQRVSIARALINQPAVLFADEPSGNLDSQNRDEIHRLFLELKAKFGQTIVLVTHDEKLASMGDRCIRIVDGRVVEE
ncbi:MAG: ABC transporter ATP-binding protein [Alistipes sp.]|nr:ABC transporter ATP-binding protein [Alistipes sp.]